MPNPSDDLMLVIRIQIDETVTITGQAGQQVAVVFRRFCRAASIKAASTMLNRMPGPS